MSRLEQIRGNWESLTAHLPDILVEADEELKLAPLRLAMKGKTLEECLKEQAAYPIIYANLKSELNTVLKYINAKMDHHRGALFRNYTENYSRELSDRAKDKYIDNDDDYLNYQELYLEVKELADKAEAVVDAYTTRGFALRDVTQLRINQLHTTVL